MSVLMTDLPQSERPRERLLAAGPNALSDAELLAIILGKGTQGKSVLQLTQELLAKFGSLHALADTPIEELMHVRGVGQAKAIQIKAAFTLAKRSLKPEFIWRYPIHAPQDLFRYIYAEFCDQDKEKLVIILRDSRGSAYHHEVLAVGSLNTVLVQPREIITKLASRKAHSFFLCHNHPTGDVTPSSADWEFTRKVENMANVVGIPLMDHLIIAQSEFESLYRLGAFSKRSRY